MESAGHPRTCNQDGRDREAAGSNSSSSCLYIQSGALQDIPFHLHLGAGSVSRRFEERLGRCFRLAHLTSDERGAVRRCETTSVPSGLRSSSKSSTSWLGSDHYSRLAWVIANGAAGLAVGILWALVGITALAMGGLLLGLCQGMVTFGLTQRRRLLWIGLTTVAGPLALAIGLLVGSVWAIPVLVASSLPVWIIYVVGFTVPGACAGVALAYLQRIAGGREIVTNNWIRWSVAAASLGAVPLGYGMINNLSGYSALPWCVAAGVIYGAVGAIGVRAEPLTNS